VSTVTAATETWPSNYEATGTVRARTSAVISAKLMGYVREVKVQAGDRVREGQLLVTLDTRDLDVSSRRAEAAREEVRSSVPEADSAVAAAKANLDLAQVTFDRMRDLFQKTSISNQEFDEASAKLKAAQAAYEMAQARRLQLNSKLAQVDQEVRATEVTRSYADVLAPFAGVVISRKSVDPGSLALPGVPLFTIEREGAYRLEASVEESRLAAIRVGQPVSVTLDGVDHGRTQSMRGSPRSCPPWTPPRALTQSRSICPRSRRFARASSGARRSNSEAGRCWRFRPGLSPSAASCNRCW
jgi:multidrug efflux system membrane fusion protein